jgi:hypothetical protein
MDQAPGPIIAEVPLRTANARHIQILVPPATTIQSSTPATSAPAKGVPSPAKMNNPKIAPNISGITRPAVGVCS